MSGRGIVGLGVLKGANLAATLHEPDHDDQGVTFLELLTQEGRLYRFATQILGGEETEAGWSCEHFSLTIEERVRSEPSVESTDLRGIIARVEQILADEWVGPVDHTLDALGSNPRSVFFGKVGECPPYARPTTVLCGVLLHSEAWRLLVYAFDSFPLRVGYTADAQEISEFGHDKTIEEI